MIWSSSLCENWVWLVAISQHINNSSLVGKSESKSERDTGNHRVLLHESFNSAVPADCAFSSCRLRFKSRPEHHRAACVETPSREYDTRWMKQFGHAGDRKNELPFRVNSFHPNDLVARSKRTGDAQRGPRPVNSVFGFFLSNLDCQGLPVVGIMSGLISRPS